MRINHGTSRTMCFLRKYQLPLDISSFRPGIHPCTKSSSLPAYNPPSVNASEMKTAQIKCTEAATPKTCRNRNPEYRKQYNCGFFLTHCEVKHELQWMHKELLCIRFCFLSIRFRILNGDGLHNCKTKSDFCLCLIC